MSERPTANTLYRACQDLIRAGQPVFPCFPEGSRAKRPMTKNGFKDATLDREKCKRWWKSHPDAAIGISTGVIHDVLDVDVKNGADGRVHLTKLNRLGLLNGCQKVAKTPSGGWHLYFPATPGLTNRANAALGLDLRAAGGYVLAPPSYVNDGEASIGSYMDMGPTVGAVAEPVLWDLIVAALAPMNAETNKPVDLLPSDRRASIAALREWMSVRKPGERNPSLYWAVSRCIDNGIDPHEMVEPAMLTGLAEEEILTTIGSALKRAGVSAEELDTEAEALFPQAG